MLLSHSGSLKFVFHLVYKIFTKSNIHDHSGAIYGWNITKRFHFVNVSELDREKMCCKFDDDSLLTLGHIV